MTTPSITENQKRQLKQFLESFVASAVQAALEQVVPNLSKDGAQLVIGRGNELKADVEMATVNSLKRLLMLYPMLAETQLLTVPADLSHAERIQRGNYGWVTIDLTEKRFPVTADQLGEWEWKLFRFDRGTSSEEAIRLMKEEGFEPGQIGHILTFGEVYPEEQRKYPIIGLGSVAKIGGGHGVPGLWDDNRGRRKLRLNWFANNNWSADFRFLGVRRRSVA